MNKELETTRTCRYAQFKIGAGGWGGLWRRHAPDRKVAIKNVARGIPESIRQQVRAYFLFLSYLLPVQKCSFGHFLKLCWTAINQRQHSKTWFGRNIISVHRNNDFK